MSRTSTVVESVSEIMTDENGFCFIDLVLGDGTRGFFPGKADTLSAFTPGVSVLYSSVKKFNGMDKINGLTVEEKKPTVTAPTFARITDLSEVSPLNGWMLKSITLDNGVTAGVIAKHHNGLSQYRVGNLVSYVAIRETEEFGSFFDGFKKEFEYTGEDRRNMSITRQSCLKAATELYLAANSSKLAKSANVNWDDVLNDVIHISDKLVAYTNID